VCVCVCIVVLLMIQSFNESTDLILLTTNLFKKEFVNHLNSYYCMGLALNCLGNIATKDLARDCISDVLQLMSHPKPYIRKKAIITMYKIYIKYPQGFRITFDQLKDKLDDEDSSVVSCAVNVICELANKNPRNYLAMAPKFFKLLTTSSNNWMLIKVKWFILCVLIIRFSTLSLFSIDYIVLLLTCTQHSLVY
jgi:AP-3 complex subunit delta-1